jgi:hypothetical protein
VRKGLGLAKISALNINTKYYFLIYLLEVPKLLEEVGSLGQPVVSDSYEIQVSLLDQHT